MSRKDDAFREFKQVIGNYIRPLISCNGKLRFVDEAHSGELKKLIALYPHKNMETSRVNIYPCFLDSLNS